MLSFQNLTCSSKNEQSTRIMNKLTKSVTADTSLQVMSSGGVLRARVFCVEVNVTVKKMSFFLPTNFNYRLKVTHTIIISTVVTISTASLWYTGNWCSKWAKVQVFKPLYTQNPFTHTCKCRCWCASRLAGWCGCWCLQFRARVEIQLMKLSKWARASCEKDKAWPKSYSLYAEQL